jgi:hypothetical protein
MIRWVLRNMQSWGAAIVGGSFKLQSVVVSVGCVFHCNGALMKVSQKLLGNFSMMIEPFAP